MRGGRGAQQQRWADSWVNSTNFVIRGFCCSRRMTDQERDRNSNKEIRQGQKGQCYNIEVQSVEARGLILIIYLLIFTMETTEHSAGSSHLGSYLIPSPFTVVLTLTDEIMEAEGLA